MTTLKTLYRILPFLLIAIFISGCKTEPELFTAVAPEVAVPTQKLDEQSSVIIFSELVIELETRRLLGRPSGDITQEDVLSITVFGAYDNELGKFGDLSGDIDSLIDLKWFKNLEKLVLSGCNISSLHGIEELTKLQTLFVRRNNITSIEPVRNLVNLTDFDCSGNPVGDYSPLSALVNLESLSLGYNRMEYTDLNPLRNLTKLKSLYAPRCGISDISVLENMPSLEYLHLVYNNIRDINALKELDKLTYLDLRRNQISDITAIERLSQSQYDHLDLADNPIPEEALESFYAPKASDYFVKTFRAKLNEGMSEFVFELLARFDRKMEGYAIETLTITDTSDGAVIQKIPIPELTLFGQTNVYSKDSSMGFELEDLNFDGYLDIRIFDTTNGNYLEEWIYLVWKPDKRKFEEDTRLNEIRLASFDQEKQLIYGMERDGAVRHYYSTYQYIAGTPTLIRYVSEEGLYIDDERLKEYLNMASIQTDVDEIICFHVSISERDEKTKKMKVVKDEYVFYRDSNDMKEEDIIARIETASKIGKVIQKDEEFE